MHDDKTCEHYVLQFLASCCDPETLLPFVCILESSQKSTILRGRKRWVSVKFRCCVRIHQSVPRIITEDKKKCDEKHRTHAAKFGCNFFDFVDFCLWNSFDAAQPFPRGHLHPLRKRRRESLQTKINLKSLFGPFESCSDRGIATHFSPGLERWVATIFNPSYWNTNLDCANAGLFQFLDVGYILETNTWNVSHCFCVLAFRSLFMALVELDLRDLATWVAMDCNGLVQIKRILANLDRSTATHQQEEVLFVLLRIDCSNPGW